MNGKEYIEMIMLEDENVGKISKIEELYGFTIPDILRKIVSNSEKTVFLEDEKRILSYNEIIDAEKDLHVEFKSKGIIPFADCGENNFVVYSVLRRQWAYYNIIDDTMFKEKTDIHDLM